MTREDILIEVYNSQIIRKMSNKFKDVLGSDIEDFNSYALEVICELPDDKIIKLYEDKQLYFYIVSICRNQITNPGSKYNRLMENNIQKDNWDDWMKKEEGDYAEDNKD